MEAMKSRRNASKRKPFTDLSNTIPPSLPSSLLSSSIKPQTRPSHSLPLKPLLNHNRSADLSSNANITTTRHPIYDSVHNDKNYKKDKVKSQCNKLNPSSALSPPPKSPSVSVYSRRRTAEKRKNKGKEIMEPLSCSLETRMSNFRRKDMEKMILVSPNHAVCHLERNNTERGLR
ncbi:uncharacterized protein LOC120198894 isoform X2 [Hibiscus syriacus]|uniref:uncharacterized protein LOC120198894 isoform X2 n=1 Tax=Hibiscus syriacus TaxID=106335 RepID=UPI001920BE2A|nr:uncharacterized protein LOC120198894 isoform X2 [Hibiscus syriacus]